MEVDLRASVSNGSAQMANSARSVSIGSAPMANSEKITPERGAWGNQMEFFLTCVGFAVGLGNVWRFPFLTFQNGGGAFLIPYIGFLILCGFPLFFLELAFGQFSSLGPLSLWNTASPMFKGIGVSLLCLCIAINLTYGVLLSTILYFLFASMASEVPWAHCNNRWNSELCIEAFQRRNKTFMEDFRRMYNVTNEQTKTPSEEYYYQEVLKISGGIEESGPLVWQLVCCLFITWVVTFLALVKGIGSLGKVVYFTSTFPYIMMTIMIVRGATLPGSLDGIIYYLKPDFNRLADAKVWSEAASQIFYSLSCCSGGLIAMASYNRFNNNVLRDTALIPIINCGTSIYAGFAIFSVLGFMAQEKDVDIKDVAESGPGLIFVVYPEALAEMPLSPLWSILFFLMMATLGFSTAFSQTEAMFVCFQDEFPAIIRSSQASQLLFRATVCFVSFLATLPMMTRGGFYLFNLADTYCTSFPRLIIGFFQILALVWLYGASNFWSDVNMMVGKEPNLYIKVTLVVIMPIIIIAILLFTFITFEPLTLFNGAYQYPVWGDAMAWLMVSGVVISIPLWALVVWIRSGTCDIRESYRPLPNWGPARPENRTGRYSPEGTGNMYDTRLAIISIDSTVSIETNNMNHSNTTKTPIVHHTNSLQLPYQDSIDKNDIYNFRF